MDAKSSLSDEWPDLPHRIAPAADYVSGTVPARRPPAGDNRPTLPLPPPRRPRRRRAPLFIAAALVLAAAAGVFLYVRRPPSSTAAAPVAAPSTPAPVAFRVTEPLGELRSASFVLASSASAVRIRAGDTEADLYRASSPRGGSVRPVTKLSGTTARLELATTGQPGAEAVDIMLSARVRWTIRIEGSINTADIDVSKAAVAEVLLAGDAADFALRLPAPRETLPVRVTGGINKLRVAAGNGVPVRVRARGGAGTAVITGRTVRGVARGRVFEPAAWRRADDRVDVDVRAGLGEIRVD